jgi:hypothetical protein
VEERWVAVVATTVVVVRLKVNYLAISCPTLSDSTGPEGLFHFLTVMAPDVSTSCFILDLIFEPPTMYISYITAFPIRLRLE